MSWWSEGPASRVLNDPGLVPVWNWEDFGHGGGDGAFQDLADSSLPLMDGQALEAERETGFRAGYDEGLEAGRTDGEARAEARFRDALDAVKTALTGIEALTEARWEAAEERVLVLALAVARRLLDREIRTDPAEVAQLVRSALSLFPSEVPLKVRLNPEDLSALVQPAEGEVAPPSLGRGGSLRWEADPDLGRGDVYVEAPERILDGRVTTCLERIWEELSHA
ncbi:MAG: hypothetical protein EA421_08940 [Gemmatimonadales bacterium]|nr:MAG: hypothetical protein EA421_08940 [Gemmatimonadales bacterium]